jgi:agmatinase
MKNEFNPNQVGVKNGNFIGLPYTQQEAQIILFPVPWDCTASYGKGTATGPQNILEASIQLDLEDPIVPKAWERKLYYHPISKELSELNSKLNAKTEVIINFLESGGNISENNTIQELLNEVNSDTEKMVEYVQQQTSKFLKKNVKIGLIGGEHSIPLGYLRALKEKYDSFGILQIDAHFDLREGYEGFKHSHASIFFNVMEEDLTKSLFQVGIRDYCLEEKEYADSHPKIQYLLDHQIKHRLMTGDSFHSIVKSIIDQLPDLIYISFDIDGLQPYLCPNTGTPVPGGLSFEESFFLLEQIRLSGKTIIGFDLCETGGIPNEWDGSVGARVAYRLANLLTI